MRAIGEELWGTEQLFQVKDLRKAWKDSEDGPLPQLKNKNQKTGVWTPVAQVFVTSFQKPLFLSNLDSKNSNYMKSIEFFFSNN